MKKLIAFTFLIPVLAFGQTMTNAVYPSLFLCSNTVFATNSISATNSTDPYIVTHYQFVTNVFFTLPNPDATQIFLVESNWVADVIYHGNTNTTIVLESKQIGWINRSISKQIVEQEVTNEVFIPIP